MARELLFAAAVAVGLIAHAGPAAAATPISDWKIESSDARCVAVRQYGSAEAPVTLAIKAPVEGDALQLAVLRSGRQPAAIQRKATLTLDGKKFEPSALSYPVAGLKRKEAHLLNLDTDVAGAFRAAGTAHISVQRGVSDTFALSPATQVWKDLQGCVDRLRNTWNAVDDRPSRIATEAIGDLQQAFKVSDYPLSMVRAENMGTVGFALLIDETGKVRDCTVTNTSSFAVFDSRSCGIIIERAKFEPARDPMGKAVKSSRYQRVTWRLEN